MPLDAAETSAESVMRAARRLRDAYAGKGVPPLRDFIAPLDIDVAYAVQDANTAFWRAQGRAVAGFKVGLTSAAARAQLGVNEPDAGVLFLDRQVRAGARIAKDVLLEPRVEGEIALRIGHDLIDPAASAASVAAAVAAAAPAVQVVDSRISGWRITAADTIADNGSAGLFVVGEFRDDVPWSGLAELGMDLAIDGEVVVPGTGAAAFGHPLEALAWLARHRALAERPLRAGDIVLTGALGPMTPVSPGVRVEVSVARLGRIAVSFDG